MVSPSDGRHQPLFSPSPTTPSSMGRSSQEEVDSPTTNERQALLPDPNQTTNNNSLTTADHNTLTLELINPNKTDQHRTVSWTLTKIGLFMNEQQKTDDKNRLILQSCWSACLPPTKDEDLEICLDYQNIINCQSIDTNHTAIELSAFTSTDPKKSKLITLNGFLSHSSSSTEHAQNWIETLLENSYKGLSSRHRRLMVIVNPYGGSGLAKRIWNETVQPILKKSFASFHVEFTQRSGHATEIGENMNINDYDVVVCVSGDGIIHELINGLGRRKDGGKALRKLSIAAIPAGSGNGLAANHMGPKDGKNAVLATLTVLKGRPLPLDLCSVTQESDEIGGKPVRSLSFLSTSFGLMAELDVGTEPWRWMGSTRFILGYLWGAIKNRYQKVRIDMQLIEDDKKKIEEQWQDRRVRYFGSQLEQNIDQEPREEEELEGEEGLPRLKFGDVDEKIIDGQKGWKTLICEVTSIYIGTLPFMASDLLEFPVKIPGDGSIDLIIHHSPNTLSTLKCIDGADQGSMFKNSHCQYFKTRAIRITPLTTDIKKKSYIVVDGENKEYKPTQVEIHNNLSSVLSLFDHHLGQKGLPDQYLT